MHTFINYLLCVLVLFTKKIVQCTDITVKIYKIINLYCSLVISSNKNERYINLFILFANYSQDKKIRAQKNKQLHYFCFEKSLRKYP